MTNAFNLRNRTSHLAIIAMLCALAGPQAIAGPEGGTVTAGAARISAESSGATTIHQSSDRAIVDWQRFDVGTRESVSFFQPGQDAAILNRVTGGAGASRIDGSLTSNGQVFVLNPDGVVIGETGEITSRGGFVASTLDLEDTAFMQGGDLRLRGDGGGAVVNEGVIASSDGDVVLVAPKVGNHGRISAESGVVALGAGTEAWLRPAGDQLLHIDAGLQFGGQGVDNQGVIEAAQAELKAAGGSAYDLAINQAGTVRATGVERRDGRILLSSGGGALRVSGAQEARNADGSGGEIYVGGGVQGNDAAISNAKTLEATESAVFDVSAAEGQGKGGTAVLWSDAATSFRGSLWATGGGRGGDGGFAEVSGLASLDFRPSSVDLSAAFGADGTLLLDPDDLQIVTSRGQSEEAVLDGGMVISELGSGVWEPFRGGGSEVLASTVLDLLDDMNVILQASGSIYNLANLEASPENTNNLTLTAGENIFLHESIDLQLGDLEMLAGGKIEGPTTDMPVRFSPQVTANRVTIGASGETGLSSVDLQDVGLNAQEVALKFGLGISGDVNLTSAGNIIGEVNLQAADDGGFSGALKVVNGGDGLTVNGSLAETELTGLSIVTEGDLTLGYSFDLSDLRTTGALDLVLASTDGNILSEAPESAFSGLDASANQRLLAYSTNKALTRLATELSLTEVAGESYASAPPSDLPEDGISRRFHLAGLTSLTLTADDISRMYGARNGELTFSVAGLIGSDTFDTVTEGDPELSVAANVKSNIGDYEISIGQGDLELTVDTYTGFAFVPGTLSVTPAELIASPTPTTVTYGDSYRIPVTFSGFRNGDTALSLGLSNVEAQVEGLGRLPDVGTYDAVYDLGAFGNYTITDNGAADELEIRPRPLTVRMRDQTRTYGARANFLDPIFEGLVRAAHEDDFTVAPSSAATVGSDVGSYAITGVVSGAAGSAENYDVSVVPGLLNVTPAPLAFSVDGVSRLYGDSNPSFSVTPVGGTSWLNGDDVSDVTLSFSTPADETANVGTYGVTVSGTALNYSIETRRSSAALTVMPAPLEIAVEDLTKVYGETADGSWLNFEADGLKLSDTVADLGPLQAESTGFRAQAGVVDGGYQVHITGIANGNYSVDMANTPTLSVTPATLDVNVGTASRAYGDSAFTVAGTTANGLMAWDRLEDLGLIYSSEISDIALDAGETRPIDVELTDDVINYTLGQVNQGIASVTRRQVQGVITPFERYFGSTTSPKLLVLNLVNGDTQSDIDSFGFEGAHDDGLTDVGQYTIYGHMEDNNYELSNPAQGTMTILPRLITVEVPNQSRTYGDTETLQIEIGNLAPGHGVADVLNGGGFYSDGMDPHANVGTYDVTGGIHNQNYQVLSQFLGRVTVQPAVLDVDMGDVTVPYGETPDATYTVDGLRNGESLDNLFVQYGPRYLLRQFSLPEGRQEDMVDFGYQPAVLSDGRKPMDNYYVRVDRGAMEVVRRQIYVAAHDIRRELAGDWQVEELDSNLVYEGGTLVGGQLVNGNALGLAYVGDPRTLIPGQTAKDVLQVVVTLNGNDEDPDAKRKYDITYVGDLGDVITIDNQVILPVDIISTDEIESTTTTYTMDNYIHTDGNGNILDPEVCESLGKTMVDGICDMGSNRITVHKAPDVTSPLTSGLMSDLTSTPSGIMVNVFSAYLTGAITSGAVGTEMIYLLDDMRNKRIDGAEFMARVAAHPDTAGMLTDAMDGYVQALVNADPADLTEAETLLRWRYEYRARRMAEKMYWDLVAAKLEDDKRRAAEDATLGGLVAKAPAGFVLDGVLGNYKRDLAEHMLAGTSAAGLTGLGAAMVAVPVAYVTNTASTAAALAGTIATAGAESSAGLAAQSALTNMATAFGGTASSAIGVAGGVFIAAAVIGVQSGIAQSVAANRETELESFMARLKPSDFNPANVPPALHSLIMSELATGATLGGN